MTPTLRRVALIALAVATSSCLGGSDDNGSTEPEVVDLAFVPTAVDLGDAQTASVLIENRGNVALGPIALELGPVTLDGAPVGGLALQVDPNAVALLEPDSQLTLTLTLAITGSPAPGGYSTSLAARWAGQVIGMLAIGFAIAPPPANALTVTITAGSSTPRQGDAESYAAEVRDGSGALVSDSTVGWSVTPASAGLLTPEGIFVGYLVGPARLIARVADAADTLEIDVTARGLSGSFATVGRGEVTARYTSDLWVHGDFAYTGTWSCRGGSCGDRLYSWNVSDPAAPLLTDSIIVDAQTVNDVKVRADGTIAVITHEGSSDGLNGISLLDLADPAHPSLITRFTQGLESGVHNVWIEGDYVYAAADGPGVGLRIIEISDPSNPRLVASFYAGSSILHDVYVRDGLAFLSHWNAGLVILDVGNGLAGGSPMNPVEVGRIQTAGGQTHNAWYWPAAGYVFVGEEDTGTPGVMHVVDASDLANLKEVATFASPGATPHNLWLDEGRGILYAAWYENGLRAIDVSGELLGALDRQGREIAFSIYGTGSGCFGGSATCNWAPQLHRGDVFLSDLNSGLWVLRGSF